MIDVVALVNAVSPADGVALDDPVAPDDAVGDADAGVGSTKRVRVGDADVVVGSSDTVTDGDADADADVETAGTGDFDGVADFDGVGELVGVADFDGVTGVTHDSVYVAGPDAVVTGLVTTRTASPLPASPAGVNVSGVTARVPGAVKSRVCDADCVPSDCAQW